MPRALSPPVQIIFSPPRNAAAEFVRECLEIREMHTNSYNKMPVDGSLRFSLFSTGGPAIPIRCWDDQDAP
jgi:hypothetical protein